LFREMQKRVIVWKDKAIAWRHRIELDARLSRL
jgi:hypothetical protein